MKLVRTWDECLSDLRGNGHEDVANHVEFNLAKGEKLLCTVCRMPLGEAHIHAREVEAICSEGCAIKSVGPGSVEPEEVLG